VGRVLRLLELSAIFTLGTFVVVSELPGLALLGFANGDYGMTFATRRDSSGHDALTVVAVKPGSPAAKAGVLRGDHLPANASLFERFAATATVRPGDTYTFDLVRATSPRPVTLVAARGRVFVEDNPFNRVFIAIRIPQTIVLAVVAVLLVLRAPSKMTWGLALFLLSLSPGQTALRYVAPMVGPVFEQIIGAIYGGLDVLGHFGVLVFALRFPRNEPRGFAKAVDACAWPVAGAVVIFRWMAARIGYLYWSSASLAYAVLGVGWCVVYLPIVAAVLLVLTLMRSSGVERRRLQWVIAGVVLGCIVQPLNTSVSVFHNTPGMYAARVFGMSTILVPLFVAYGVLRHRVLDVGFVVNRAAIYAAVTAVLVGVMGAVKLLAGSYLKGTFSTALQIATAIGLGLSTQRIYKIADWLVDRYIFPNVHATEIRLKRLGEGLKYSRSTDVIASALTAEAADAMNLGSAALFRRRADGLFVRRAAVGWSDDDVTSIEARDPLTLYFEGDPSHLDLRALLRNKPGFPPGTAAPQHGFPLVVAREPAGFVLFADHADGTALDPDEIAMLEKLVKSAGDAYDPLLRVKTALREAGRQMA
jgi:hypothetical protein